MYRELRKKLLVRKVTGCLKLLEKKKLLSVWRIQAAVQGFFTVKQSIREISWVVPESCQVQAWNFTELSIESVMFYQYLIFLELLRQRRYLLETINNVSPVLKSFNSWVAGHVLKSKGVKKRDKVSLFWVS